MLRLAAASWALLFLALCSSTHSLPPAGPSERRRRLSSASVSEPRRRLLSAGAVVVDSLASSGPCLGVAAGQPVDLSNTNTTTFVVDTAITVAIDANRSLIHLSTWEAPSSSLVLSPLGNAIYSAYASGRLSRTVGKLTSGGSQKSPNFDGMPALAYAFDFPYGSGLDSAGDVVFSDMRTLNRLNLLTGTVSIIAGGAEYSVTCPHAGDGGLATSASVGPLCLALDAKDNIFFVDGCGGISVVRRIDSASGIIIRVAGSTTKLGFQDGPALDAQWSDVIDVAVDAAGTVLLLADVNNYRVRRVDLVAGIVETVAGNGKATDAAFCLPGPAKTSCVGRPRAVAFEAPGCGGGNGGFFFLTNEFVVYVNGDGVVRRRLQNATASIVAGQNGAYDLGVSATDSFLRMDILHSAGQYTLIKRWQDGGDDCSNDLLYVTQAHITLMNATTNTTRIIIGARNKGSGSTDGSSYRSASFLDAPESVAFNAAGDMFVVDSANNRILRSDRTTGVFSVWAGGTTDKISGVPKRGYWGDGGPATSAGFYTPVHLTFDPATGDGYVSDYYNCVIRVVYASNLTVATVAGSGTLCGFSGDGGAATSARLNLPKSTTFNPAGELCIVDERNNRIRAVNLTSRRIRTFAGYGSCIAVKTEDRPAAASCLWNPLSIAFDTATGDAVIADTKNHRLRRYFASNGTIATIGGNFTRGFCDDNVVLSRFMACFQSPAAVAFDKATGDFIIADTANCIVRRLRPNNTLLTILGSRCNNLDSTALSPSFFPEGFGAPPTLATVGFPKGLAFDDRGALFVADREFNLVYALPPPPPPPPPAGTPAVATLRCPQGFACGDCGTPVPCTDPSRYCAIDSRIPAVVSTGYYSTPEGAGVYRSGQRPCPKGSYCSGGVRFPCLTGFFNPAPLQISRAACRPCPLNTFSRVIATGASSSAQEACTRCEPGSVTSGTGALFCSWCAPGTFAGSRNASGAAAHRSGDDDTRQVLGAAPWRRRMTASSSLSSAPPAVDVCLACPPGTFSLGGATSCAPLQADAMLFSSGSTFMSLGAALPLDPFARSEPGPSSALGSSSSSSTRPISIAITAILILFTSPLVAHFLLTLLASLTSEGSSAARTTQRLDHRLLPTSSAASCCRLSLALSSRAGHSDPKGAALSPPPPPPQQQPPPNRHCFQSALALLARVDSFGYRGVVGNRDVVPVQKTTPLGGAVSCAAFGAFLAILVALVAHLFDANGASVLMAPVSASLASLPVQSVGGEGPSGGDINVTNANGTTISSGVLIEVLTMGSMCASLRSWSTQIIPQGDLSYAVFYDSATQHARHTFFCADCFFGPLSALNVFLPIVCQTFFVRARTVGVTGDMTAGMFSFASPCGAAVAVDLAACVPVNSVAVAMSLTLEVSQGVPPSLFSVSNLLGDDAPYAGRKRGYAVTSGSLYALFNEDKTSLWLRVGLPAEPAFLIPRPVTTNVLGFIAAAFGLFGVFAFFRSSLARAEHCSKLGRERGWWRWCPCGCPEE